MKISMKYLLAAAVLAVCVGGLPGGCANGAGVAGRSPAAAGVAKSPSAQPTNVSSTAPSLSADSLVHSPAAIAIPAPVKKNNPKAAAPITAAKRPAPIVTTVPVLYYHSVLVEAGNELRMPPDQFDTQMKYLSEHGYHVITPDQLYAALYGNGKLPAKPFMITFDDGYADNYTNAYPILQKYHFVATVFMVSNFVNGKNFLSADQLRTLQAAGWTIAGHTANHTDLSKANATVINQELQTSSDALGAILGHPLKYFAYPFGGYNSSVIVALKQHGYLMAFTTQRGWAKKNQSAFLVQRVYCYANMGMKEFVHRVTNPNY